MPWEHNLSKKFFSGLFWTTLLIYFFNASESKRKRKTSYKKTPISIEQRHNGIVYSTKRKKGPSQERSKKAKRKSVGKKGKSRRVWGTNRRIDFSKSFGGPNY